MITVGAGEALAGDGTIHGYGTPVGAGEEALAGEVLAGDGTIHGHGMPVGAGEALAGDGMPVGVGMPVGAGEALDFMEDSVVADFTIET